MRYSLTIERTYRDPQFINDIETWNDVLDILKKKLDQWTKKVYIYKFSKNDRCIGSKCVTMGNLWEVANSVNDKILI
jgi:hypothetical protein